MTIQEVMLGMGQQARLASRALARASTATKNQALNTIAQLFLQEQAALQQANALDLAAGRAKGLDDALLDRLTLTPARIEAMAAGLRQVASLPDIVGEITDLRAQPSGIRVGKMRVPLGVIGIIY